MITKKAAYFAAVALLASGGALAKPAKPSTSTTPNTITPAVALGLPGSFSQDFTVTVNNNQTFSSLSVGGLSSLFSTLNFSLGVGATNTGTVSNGNIAVTQNFNTGLTAGTYTLHVTGVSLSSNANYTVTGVGINQITPVPEPESYAMLLAGLGIMGGIARRRMQK